MAPIGPDQDDDNIFSVLTETQGSESSGEEQIPTNQNVLQQVQTAVSESTLTEPPFHSPQNSSSLQGCSSWPHNVSPSQNSMASQSNYLVDSSPIASRPQRISGCPQQDGMGHDVFKMVEDSTTISPEGKHARKKRSKEALEPPQASPTKKLKKKKKDSVIQEVVPPPQIDLQQDAPLTREQWVKHQEAVDKRFDQLTRSFQKKQDKMQKRSKARQKEQLVTIKQLQESLDRTNSGINAYIQDREGEEMITTTKLFKTLKKYIPDLIKEEKQDKRLLLHS